MESTDREAFSYTTLPPFPFLSDFSLVESKGDLKSLQGANFHQRSSSESFLIEEEQPAWLDDLLNDSETFFHKGHHRRSASDSYAYLGEAVGKLNIREESKYISTFGGASAKSQNAGAQKHNQEKGEVVSCLTVENSRDESSPENLDTSADRANNSSQVKPSGSRPDSKRSKQHNAHRSRVRKLQYIAHLERTVQILKAEGTGISAALEFAEQQNMILTMENRTLRQRLESISQEQIIKNWEQGMLEREIPRLQALYHMQKQQQMQIQHQQQQQPHNQQPKHRRNRSRDLDHQLNSSSAKNKEANSSTDTVI